MAKVTLHHSGPLGIPGGLVLAPGTETNVEDWDTIKGHGVVKLWIEAGVLTVSGESAGATDRDDLKAQADELGIEYAKNIPTDKLKELIDAKLAE